MILIRRLLPIFIAFFCAGPTIGQVATTPNLSGTWMLNHALSLYEKKNGGIAESLVIISSGESIEFRETLEDGGHTTRTYRTDGKERLTDVSHADPVVVHGYSKATWQDSTLVVQLRSHLDDPSRPTIAAAMPDGHATWRWRLSSNGRVLTETSESSFPFVDKYTLVYDKR
jgi:hypothetical protein